MFDDPDQYWSSTHEELTKFFGLALGYVALANGDRTSKHWLKAERMLLLQEQKELALGTSMGHPEGSGTGPDFAHRMADALNILHVNAIPTVQYVEAFALFCDGMGVDRNSDAFCNIIKSKLVDYTAQVVARHGLVH